MSFNLWKYLLEDDVDGFRQYLARATYIHGSSKPAAPSATSIPFKIGSPGNLATSPRTPTKARKLAINAASSSGGRAVGPVITRANVNARDSMGRTILHHAASSHSANATEFIKALLEIPTIDLYIQDAENGWTALHRALYAGNIDIAQLLLTRDALNATDYTNQSRTPVGGLVKIKDHEGNSPFEVFGMTIAPRELLGAADDDRHEGEDDDETNSVDVRDDAQEDDRSSRQLRPQVDLQGDEAYAFGSNKNLSLGLGDEDDRQFPERIQLDRPEHLLWRLYEDHKASRAQSDTEDLAGNIDSLHQADGLPAIIRHKAIEIQDIVMAKLHTAILTTDPVSNLHICGFGPGGRLGTGDETTRFKYVCIQGGGLASRRVASIALGQDHCVAICSTGEVFTWGSNKHGQLGYALPEVSPKESPVQLTPRQLYGLVKKETIIGAAASSIHSVIYTTNGMYTFGKNEGQLGLMDADARSLQIQDVPRRVGVSLLQSSIRSVSAIDRATTVLLENRDVIIFTHYGFTKVVFPLEESNIFLSQALPTRYSKEANTICKITSGGNTIGALSTFGQVFTVDVPKPQEAVPASVSTTNPNKARNALPVPSRVWTIKKTHMSATDVAIGQDGSIIICTEAGSVWKKEKRANIKSVHVRANETTRPKDYKFVRMPYITRAIAVRSNAFGAFTAVRKDCEVTRNQIVADPSTLSDNIFPLLSFHKYGAPQPSQDDETATNPELRFWLPARRRPSASIIKNAILKNISAEEDFVRMLEDFEPLSETQYDVWMTSNVTDVRIPVHSTILKARSRVLRSSLAEFQEKYYFSIADSMSIEYGRDGDIEIRFPGADFLTLVNLALYMYTEDLIDVWRHTSKALALASRYRQVRVELMKIALQLELRALETAVRVMVDPKPCMMQDFEIAYMDLDLYTNADVLVELADGLERPAHSLLLSSRCPFFEGLFYGRAAGMWLRSRRVESDGAPEPTRVDLKHIDVHIFDLVLRYIYADTGQELFENVVSADLDEFVDTVIEVMSVANELMLDRLVQICQAVIGKYVTPRNICGLLNAVAESSVDQFKIAALEYICLNMDGMLEQRYLTDLDQYLLEELDEVVQENQEAFMPFVRSDRAQNELIERHPELAEQLERSRQQRIDSMRLQTRLAIDDERPTAKARTGSYDKHGSSPVNTRKTETLLPDEVSPKPSPAILPNDTGYDLPFNMDEDVPAGAQRDAIRTPLLQHHASATNSPAILSSSNKDVLKNGGNNQYSDLNHKPTVGGEDSHARERRLSGFELPKAAWMAPITRESKTDLKQIMEQASLSRVSNLTEAMKAAGSSRVSVQKTSQKERKRQQQRSLLEQQQEQSEQQSRQHSNSTKNPLENVGSPQSPWTKVAPVNKPNLSVAISEASTSSSAVRPIPQRPNLATRQATAESPSQSKSQAKQQRSVSTPIGSQAAANATPPIQSIRHTPLPTRSASFIDAHTPMSDILAQQLGEKAAIREAAAKRSLQEIQQEQEFQEWWDQESKKVQDEAARASAVPAGRIDKSTRGKGGRRRGSGRGGATGSSHKDRESKPSIQQTSVPINSEHQATPGGGEGRGRGHGRGRGRGTPRHEREAKTA